MLRFAIFLHVMGAIVAVGPSLTYGVWLALARRTGPDAERFVFRGILWLDSRIVTPAFGWQLLTGLWLVFGFGLARLDEPWLAASLVIYATIAVLGLAVVGPRARRAAAALEASGPVDPAYVAYRRMMRRLTPVIAVGTLAIVFLMVVRPRWPV